MKIRVKGKMRPTRTMKSPEAIKNGKKVTASERKLREECNQADSQLNSATREIAQLKVNLIKPMTDLKTLVDKLKQQKIGDRSKLRSVTTDLARLQKKMVQILKDTETRVGDEAEEELSLSTSMVQVDMSGSLRENIANFEKDFGAKLNQIEEEDKQIQEEILKTNQMLDRIEASILEKVPGGGGGACAGTGGEEAEKSSAQVTGKSIKDQDGGKTVTRSSLRTVKKNRR